MPTITPDASSYGLGADIPISIGSSSEAPDSVTLDGVPLTIKAGATSSAAVINGPEDEDFQTEIEGGDPHPFAYTRFGQDLTLVVGFPTEADASATIQIEPAQASDFFVTAGAGPYPSTTRFEAGTAENDEVLFQGEGVLSVGTDGVIVLSTTPVSATRRWFDLSVGMWSAIDTILLTTGDYPNLPMTVKIFDEAAGETTRTSSGGTIRSVDLNAANTYRFVVSHKLLTAAQLQELMDFYDANRRTGITLSPANDPYTYNCLFQNEPDRDPENSVYTNVTVKLKGVRV